MIGKDGRFCDLVMQGGLTSGIVYPQAVLELSKSFCFKNIGGTSAGAIAAAVTAAAELGERRLADLATATTITGPHNEVGMAGLGQVTQTLQSKDFIYRLFQPNKATRPAFDLLVALGQKRQPKEANSTSTSGPIAPMKTGPNPAGIALRAILRAKPCALALLVGIPTALATVALLHLPPGFVGASVAVVALIAVAASIVAGLTLSAILAALDAAKAINTNRLGLCSGTTQAGFAADSGLTDWMHSVTCQLAGYPTSRPVTFGDLWNAPRYQNEDEGKVIRLEMITTDVSHQQPRTLPEMSKYFWYRKHDFDELFPKEIVATMVAAMPPGAQSTGPFTPMPHGRDLPIVVAARMSLSFPILISAIPLYQPRGLAEAVQESSEGATDETDGHSDTLLQSVDALAGGGQPATAHDVVPSPGEMQECWFTDGGASSNFPLHLFDAPIPRWPTFAINLVYPDRPDRKPDHPATLPTKDVVPPARYVSIEQPSAVGRLSKFLFGIVSTMQDWRDNLQERAPGQRDRVVSIFLGPGEGGMNLRMPAPVIQAAAEKGAMAGQLLAGKFNFNSHLGIRERVVVASLEKFVADVAKVPESALAGTAVLLSQAGPYPFTTTQLAKVSKVRVAFSGLTTEFAPPPRLKNGAPLPLPALKITPTF